MGTFRGIIGYGTLCMVGSAMHETPLCDVLNARLPWAQNAALRIFSHLDSIMIHGKMGVVLPATGDFADASHHLSRGLPGMKSVTIDDYVR
jgi:hypothetical protein